MITSKQDFIALAKLIKSDLEITESDVKYGAFNAYNANFPTLFYGVAFSQNATGSTSLSPQINGIDFECFTAGSTYARNYVWIDKLLGLPSSGSPMHFQGWYI